MYPNPATDGINIMAPSNAQIAIYNGNGRVVEQLSNVLELTEISPNKYSIGMYFIKILTDNPVFMQKIIFEKKIAQNKKRVSQKYEIPSFYAPNEVCFQILYTPKNKFIYDSVTLSIYFSVK